MNAIIYCRVSSKEQVEGTSLESQELACRDYSRKHGLAVSKVFIEEGESAKFADRTQLLELLACCRDKTRQIEVLLVWKIDRFARNVEDHYTVKSALKKLGVSVVSVTEPIQNDPNGKLMETILAGFAQFDNDIRAVRSVQGMQQRIREGIWPWKPPLGYIPPRIGKKTTPDTPDPSCFSAIKKGWELFATGAYSKADIMRLLQKAGVKAFGGGPLIPQNMDHMFANPFYAGILRDPWTDFEHRGRHEPMVTAGDFARVQQIVAGRNNSQPHRRLSEDFPLRGQVRCPSCQSFMTGYFAQGSHKRYSYYKCKRTSCPTLSKSYRADAVHREFADFLNDTSVQNHLAAAIVAKIGAIQIQDVTYFQNAASARASDARDLSRQLSELITMRTQRLVSDEEYMSQRDALRRRIMDLDAQQPNVRDESLSSLEVNALADIIADLQAAWLALPIEAKRLFGRLILPEGHQFQKSRTAQKGLLIRTISVSNTGISNVITLIRDNLNGLMSEIRQLLALFPQSRPSDKEVA